MRRRISVRGSVRPSVRPSIFLFVRPSVCLSIHRSVCPSFGPLVHNAFYQTRARRILSRRIWPCSSDSRRQLESLLQCVKTYQNQAKSQKDPISAKSQKAKEDLRDIQNRYELVFCFVRVFVFFFLFVLRSW